MQPLPSDPEMELLAISPCKSGVLGPHAGCRPVGTAAGLCLDLSGTLGCGILRTNAWPFTQDKECGTAVFPGRGAIVDGWRPPRGTAGALCSPSGPQGILVIVPAESSGSSEVSSCSEDTGGLATCMRGAPRIQATCMYGPVRAYVHEW